MKIEVKMLECMEKYFNKYDYFEVVKESQRFCDKEIMYTIMGVIKPKKQAIKDLGKAVNWFDKNWNRNTDRFCTNSHSLLISDIIDIIDGRQELPSYWPSELTE